MKALSHNEGGSQKMENLLNLFEQYLNEWVEAIGNDEPEKMVKEISKEEYTKLTKMVENVISVGNAPQNRHPESLQEKRIYLLEQLEVFNEKADNLTRSILKENIEPELLLEILQTIWLKVKEIDFAFHILNHPKYMSFTSALQQKNTKISQISRQSMEFERQAKDLKRELENTEKQRNECIAQIQKLSQKLASQTTLILKKDSTNVQLSECAQIQKQMKDNRQTVEKLEKEHQDFKISQSQLLKQAELLSSKGDRYYFEGNYSLALDYCGKCLQLQTQAVGDDGIETISNRYRIGKAYLSQKFYPKAMESYKKMISICEINKDGGCEYVAFLNDLGHCYREMKDYQTGVEYFEQRLLRNQKSGYSSAVYQCAQLLAEYLIVLGKQERVQELKKKYPLQRLI